MTERDATRPDGAPDEPAPRPGCAPLRPADGEPGTPVPPSGPGSGSAPPGSLDETLPAAGDETQKTAPPGSFDATLAADAPLPAGQPRTSRTRSRAAPPPRRFGRYEILDEIARGGMGVVYRARQLDMNRDVALKVLLAGRFASRDDERRFEREAETAAHLNHPNIVAVYDIGEVDERRFYTMELVEGRPLAAWAKDVPLKARLRVLAKVCRAVHHAHMRGVMHRDLKPPNILVSPEGEPKILDFGLAKYTTGGDASVNTITGQTLGTPYYMAPEQAAGRVHDVDIRADVWALGVILYELVEGQVPFRGGDLLEVLARIENEDPPEFRGPADLRLVAARAMEKERAERYPTAEALAEDLERYLAGEPVSARPRSLVTVMRRWVKRHPAAAMGAAVALAALVLGAAWQLSRPGELRFAVEPAGAWIRVDGNEAGARARVRAGRHVVRVGAPGFEDLADDVYVERGESLSLAYRLEPSRGRLTLTADEDGTVAEIAGQVHGLPLVDFPMPVGEHDVILRGRGLESRMRRVRIEREARTEAWVSMPPAQFRLLRLPDTFEGNVSIRDVNGDGAADVAAFVYGALVAMDGRTGERLRTGRPTGGRATFPRWTCLDWDGDGVSDDVTVEHVDADVLVSVWSGRDAGSATDISGAPEPRLLWQRKFSTTLPGLDWPDPVACGRTLWLPFPARLVGIRAPEGSVIAEVPIGAGEALAHAEPMSGAELVVAWGGAGIAAIRPDGTAAWRVAARDAASVCGGPTGPAGASSRHPIPCHVDGRIRGVHPLDGSTAWETAPPLDGAATVYTGWSPSSAGEVVCYREGRFACLDAGTGREICRGEGLPPDPTVAGATIPGWLLFPDEDRLTLYDLRTGARAWSFSAGGRVVGRPAACEAPSGPEFWAVTDKARLAGFDARGRRLREVQVEFPPRAIAPCRLDGDGRTDLVLTGFGIQAVRSSRVLWKRRAANQVRAKPVVVRVEGRAMVVAACRWEDGSSQLRTFRGDTGEMAWRYGSSFDVMHEPALADWNGDGVLDVFACHYGVPMFLAAVDGRTGTELARFAMEMTAYPPPQLLDLDGDRRPEALVFEYGSGFRGLKAGAAKPLWTTECGVTFYPTLLSDLDGDGRPEVVAAMVSPSRDAGEVRAFGVDGSARWTAALDDATRGAPFLHDLDGDGRAEIGVPCGRDLVFLDAAGRVAGRLAGLGGGGWTGPLRLPDGGLALGTREGVVRVARDGAPVWSRRAARVTGSLGLAAVPGRTQPLVIGADWAGNLFALDLASGEEVWRMPLGGRSEHGVTVEDLDGDGVPEALVGGEGFVLWAIDLR